jgi:predicted aldo/keto reductase-like oxidoreductase
MQTSRRDFLKAGVVAAAIPVAAAALPQATTGGGATDWVTLGKSDVRVTRLAFGTGTFSGKVQRDLGQAEFTRLVRYAYDRGIRFFETADSYHGMPQMLTVALKGLPRDSYRLMTKYNTADMSDPAGTINRLRSDLGAEYVDIMLLHCVRTPTWPEDYKKLEDHFSEAKEKKVILSHGASVHGLSALDAFPGMNWLDVAMIRMNHKGTKMDTPAQHDSDDTGNVDRVTAQVHKVRSQGAGIVSMKLVGEGKFTSRADRHAALKYAMNVAKVDAVTIGYKNTAEIDEAIENLNLALKA